MPIVVCFATSITQRKQEKQCVLFIHCFPWMAVPKKAGSKKAPVRSKQTQTGVFACIFAKIAIETANDEKKKNWGKTQRKDENKCFLRRA